MNNEMQRAAKKAATLRYGTTGVITALDMPGGKSITLRRLA